MTQDRTPTDADRPVVPDHSDPEAPADDLNRDEPVPDEDRTVLGFEHPEELDESDSEETPVTETNEGPTPELTPEDVTAEVEDSDPNGNGPAGLAGNIGVSSEREGTFQRSGDHGTHKAGRQHRGAAEAPASLDPDQ